MTLATGYDRFVAIAAILVVASSFFFHTPSKNIYCGYTNYPGQGGPALRCDIRSGLRPLPPKPHGCDTDWSTSLELRPTSRGRVLCAGDSIYNPHARTLAYGETWRGGGFSCTSRASGLTCTNAQRHGFFLSRRRWRVF